MKKLLAFLLVLVMAVGLFNPFFDREIMLHIGNVGVSGGVISMLTLMLKGVLCLMASFLLVATTPFDSICAALRSMHFPATLTTLLLLTYRRIYINAAVGVRSQFAAKTATKVWRIGEFRSESLVCYFRTKGLQ